GIRSWRPRGLAVQSALANPVGSRALRDPLAFLGSWRFKHFSGHRRCRYVLWCLWGYFSRWGRGEGSSLAADVPPHGAQRRGRPSTWASGSRIWMVEILFSLLFLTSQTSFLSGVS